MMKKYITIYLLLFLASIPAFSQVNISTEQLLGNWKIIKCIEKDGNQDEKDIIGSVFHFNTSGILIAERPAGNDGEERDEKRGTWKVSGNNIILYREEEDSQKDKGTTLNVTRFDGNMLYIFDPKDEITVVFERVKN